MLDHVRIEAAEKQIDAFIESQAKRTGADEANAEAALQRAADRRKAEALRQENRTLWIHHYRRLAFVSLQEARDFRARARALEAGES